LLKASVNCFRLDISFGIGLQSVIWTRSSLHLRRRGWFIAILGLFFANHLQLRAQAPSQTDQGPSHAAQLPIVDNAPQPGTVSITQGTTNSGGDSVLSITSSVNVGPPYNGSEPNGSISPGVLPLSLADALSRALRYNLGALTEDAIVKHAEGEKLLARSALLPSVNAAISEEFERVNLRTTMGVESPMFPTAVKFNYFDARAVMLNQAVFDLVKIDNLRSANMQVTATIKAARDARDLVVLAVGGAYLQLIATRARIDSAQAQVNTAQAIADQAADRLKAGLAPRIDASRSRVQLQNEEERLRALQADLESQKLRLARIVGLPLGQRYDLTDEYVYAPLPEITHQDQALQQAMAQRSDLQAAASQLKAAEDSLKAARAERIPNLSVTADFGAAGTTPTHQSAGVYTVYGTLTVPIFEGGRIRGDVEQAAAVVQQRKAAFENLRGLVDQDVRQAFIDLNEAADQVTVAKSNVDLASDTLTESRDRFAAGITDTVEVVQAEQEAVQADDDYITAVFEHNLAKVSLARALGRAEQALPEFLRK
jgi:outer membrane protein TolC